MTGAQTGAFTHTRKVCMLAVLSLNMSKPECQPSSFIFQLNNLNFAETARREIGVVYCW